MSIVKLLWSDDLMSRTSTIVYRFFKTITGQRKQPKSGVIIVMHKTDLGSQYPEHVEVAPLNGGPITTGTFNPTTLSLSNNLLIFDCLKIKPQSWLNKSGKVLKCANLANQDWHAICRPKVGMETSTVESTIRQIVSYELSSLGNQKSNGDFKVSYNKELNEVLLTSFMNVSKTSPNNKLLETFDMLAFVQQCQAFNKKMLRILYMFNKEFMEARQVDNSFTVLQYLKLRYPKQMEEDKIRFTNPIVIQENHEAWKRQSERVQDNY